MKDLFYFGAVGDGVADDTVAIQTALDDGGALTIPQGTFKITSPVIQTKVMTVNGEGEKGCILANFASPQAGAWKVNLGSDSSRLLGDLSGFKIESNNSPAVYFDLSSGPANFINRWSMHRLNLKNMSPAGGYSIVLHNPTNTDGFFSSVISECMLYGGMNLARLGDSVTIRDNTIYGPGIGINLDSVQGATECNIVRNNITTTREAIYGGNYLQNLLIERNNIEQPNAVNPPDFCITLWGTAGMTRPIIKGNSINGMNHCIGGLVAAGYTSNGIIDENTLSGAYSAMYLHSTTSGIRIGKRNINSCTLLVTNQSTSNIIE